MIDQDGNHFRTSTAKEELERADRLAQIPGLREKVKEFFLALNNGEMEKAHELAEEIQKME